MSLKYRDSQGTETPVAGLNGASGELVPSVALQQSGTVTCNISTSDNLAKATVTFSTPMPDADYIINIEVTAWSGGGDLGTNISISGKSKNGFTIRQYVADAAHTSSMTYKWQAFKLMTDQVHEADAAHIAQNTANFAPAFSDVTSYSVSDYVTYNNILYRCTTAHTAGTWVAGHFTAVTVGERLTPLEAYTAINTLALDATFEAGITASNLQARLSGRVVQLNFNGVVVSTLKSALSTLLTFSESLPAPNSYVFIPTVDADTGTPYMLYLMRGRKLQCRTAIDGSNSPVHLIGSCTYISV